MPEPFTLQAAQSLNAQSVCHKNKVLSFSKNGWRDGMVNDIGLFGKIYEKGEIVCRQGEPGDEMYIIQSGAVEVSSRHDGHKVVLTILEIKDFFGEMSLIAGVPRSASAKARSTVRLRSIRRKDYADRYPVGSGNRAFISPDSHRSPAGFDPGPRRAAKITDHLKTGRFTEVQNNR
jgi:hypothetical protein